MTADIVNDVKDAVTAGENMMKELGEEVTGGTTTEPFGTPLADAYKGGNKRRSNKSCANKSRANKSCANRRRANRRRTNRRRASNKTRRNKNRNNRSRR